MAGIPFMKEKRRVWVRSSFLVSGKVRCVRLSIRWRREQKRMWALGGGERRGGFVGSLGWGIWCRFLAMDGDGYRYLWLGARFGGWKPFTY